MHIREMKKEEVSEAARLLHEAYAWLAEREGLTPEQTGFLQSVRGSEETVERESRTETYLVACDGSPIVGLVAVCEARITRLYVLPSHFGRGIGRALCGAAESMIRSQGHGAARLVSFPSAVPFYQVMGYRAVEVTNPRGVFAGLGFTLMEKRLGALTPDSTQLPGERDLS